MDSNEESDLRFSRTGLLLGREAMERLKGARVAVFGVGGVGGYAAEALARSGIGSLDLFDHDKVSLSNLNRQIIALESTIGLYKVDVMKERILQINPKAAVRAHRIFYMPDTAADVNFEEYHYIIDAIDTVTGKLALIEEAKRKNIPVISSMGAGNKLDPTAFEVSDIYQTSVCPLARIIRSECRKRGITGLKVVYSREKAIIPEESNEVIEGRRQIPGSVSFVPSVAGLILAGEVIKELAFK